MIEFSRFAAVVISVGIASASFAQEASSFKSVPIVTQNHGVFTRSRAPEVKKGTVLFHRRESTAPGQPLAEGLTFLQEQARKYREEGLALQEMGYYDDAMKLFTKAVELDPSLAIAYNDMGIIYEAGGEEEDAESCYLKAVEIDPAYTSAYSNLAMLYENRRDLKKAEYYWNKRADFGDENDYWRQKAVRRQEDIRLVLGEKPVDAGEEAIMDLTGDVASQKSAIPPSPQIPLWQVYFNEAHDLYKKGDRTAALKKATDAFFLDRSNKTIAAFMEKLQGELLSKKEP